ncbi:transposase, partial [Thiolapillus sp.]|uniref:transposase n=1 Tax=Thiolapillus sp. TaxID=2017437 RepID=UPI003AF520E7
MSLKLLTQQREGTAGLDDEKEAFQFFWGYVSPYWAGQFLDRWCTKTMRSKIEPMKKVAR